MSALLLPVALTCVPVRFAASLWGALLLSKIEWRRAAVEESDGNSFFFPSKLAACNFLGRILFWSPPGLFPPQHTEGTERQLFDQELKGSNTREAPYRDILVAVVGERGIETDISARDRPKNSSIEHKSHKTFSKKFFT